MGVNNHLNELEQRGVLSQLRLVCSVWTEAVESHPFWTHFIYHFGGPVIDPYTRQTSRSSTLQSTGFRAAQITSGHYCTVCAINGYRPIPAESSCTTRYSIRTPTCREHRSQHCTSCLIAGSVLAENTFPFLAEGQGDIDERGFESNGLSCRTCRHRRWQYAVISEFRGRAPPLEMIKPNRPSDAYVYDGVGSAHLVAQQNVAMTWIQTQVDSKSIFQTEALLFQHEMNLRERSLDKNEREDKYNANHRRELEGMLWGYDSGEIARVQDERGEFEESEVAELYGIWDEEMEEREMRRLDDEEDWEEDDELDESLAMERENARRQTRLINACIRHYNNARIAHGWWVHPREELHAAYKSPHAETYTPAHLARAADPFAPSEGIYSIQRYDNVAQGAYGLNFLPSSWLVNLMARDWERGMSRALEGALGELADAWEVKLGEEGVGGVGVKELLGYLRLRECWVSGGLLRKLGLEGEVQTSTPATAITPASAATPATTHATAVVFTPATAVPHPAAPTTADIVMAGTAAPAAMPPTIPPTAPAATSPEDPSLLAALLPHSQSSSSIKRSPEDDEGEKEDVKRRKESHDSSSSSADALTMSLSGHGTASSDPSTAPSSVTTPDPQVQVDEKTHSDVPLVPIAGVEIGQFAESTILNMWRAQCERVNQCRCKICVRREQCADLGEIERQMDAALCQVEYAKRRSFEPSF